jgi:1,4-dihydroxy-2-naphthoyl-CoA hydrolase
MRIWKQELTLDQVNAWHDTMVERIGIVITQIGDDYIRATMPVDGRTRQPYGLLHGGASVALAETLGSLGSMMCSDASQLAVGIEINANHVRGVSDGVVTGIARPIHLGRQTQVWEVRVEDERARLVCIARLTVAIVPRQTPAAQG